MDQIWQFKKDKDTEGKKKQVDEASPSEKKTNTVRVPNRVDRLVEKVKAEKNLSSKADAFDEIFDIAEDDIISELKDGKTLFSEELSDIRDKYLRGREKEQVLVSKFLQIFQNCNGNMSFILEMFDEVLNEVGGSCLDGEE